MTTLSYYREIAIPISTVLSIGIGLLLFTRKKSAATRQFICASTLLSALLVGLVPTIPRYARPTLPINFPVVLTVSRTPFETRALTIPSPISGSTNQFQFDFLPILACMAFAISLMLAVRLVGSLLTVSRLRKRAVAASAFVCSLTIKSVQIVPSLSSPIAIGGFKPIILLPAEAENWPEDQLRAVLIHEEAHLDNNDPDWQVLAEIVCILYWFNPLAWLMRNFMRQSAERAADDAVIRAGIQPSLYAQGLIELASRLGQTRQPIAHTTFALKNGVKDRVKAILNSKIERNPMKKPMKITAIAGLVLAAYVTSAYAEQGTAVPQSPYKDVREGKTTPAKASNEFIGRLADGREVEVIQISRQLPDRSIQAWKPDGTPLTGNQVTKIGYHPLSTLGTHARYVLLRFPEKTKGTTPNAGCGSASERTGEEPSEMGFCGGGIVSHKDGFYTVVSYIDLPKEDVKHFSAGFGVSDGLWEDHGAIKSDNPILKNVKIEQVNKPLAKEADRDFFTKHSGPYTLVDFVLPGGVEEIGDIQILPIFNDPSQAHKESNEYGNCGGFIQKPPANRIEGFQNIYYFAYPISSIKEFRYQSRNSLHCDVLGLAANPKSPY